VNSWINLTAIWQIVAVGLLAGAGLPALVATGLYALSVPGNGQVATGRATGGRATGGRATGGRAAGLVAAVLCFATVLAAIGYGIYLIISSSH
jgi:predicted alpha/beta-hydrolase family hydrolase